MEKIKLFMDEYNIKEVCLQITNDYYPDITKVETTKDDFGMDIVITVEHENYIDKIYGREIHDKYYYARHEWINKQKPDINYYDEFFCNGVELQFG